MKKNVTPDDFNRTLEWLNPDREQAGAKLEKIRRRLIEILTGRGCREAEFWADETIDRVVTKINEVSNGYEGDPAYYFYGVAKKVYLECMKRQAPQHAPPTLSPSEDVEREHACLEDCLARLADEDREAILGYYSKEGRKKIDNRNEMARKLGIGLNALRIRVYRLRIALKGCIEDCLRREAF